MDHSFFLMDSLVSRLLQDNAALFWTTANRPPPIAISMTTRFVSPTGRALGSPAAPIGRAQRQTQGPQARAQTQAQAQAPTAPAHQAHVDAGTAEEASLHSSPLSAFASSSESASASRRRRPGSSHPHISTPSRRRPPALHSPSPSSLLHNDGLDDYWPEPLRLPPTQHQLAVQAAARATASPLTNDPFLADLVDNEFSSPSTYPSFTAAPTFGSSPARQPSPSPYRPQRSQAPVASSSIAATQANIPASAPRNPSAACTLGPNLQRSTTNLTTSTAVGDSQTTVHTRDTPDSLFDSPGSSFSESMPATTRRRSGDTVPAHDAVHASKRRRTSPGNGPFTLPKGATRRTSQSKSVDVDDFFEHAHPRVAPSAEPQSDDIAAIDLTEANDVPEELKKPDVDNRVKLAAFQCVICMDDVTTLTVTHCGHLYCAQCLHSSLNVEATKGKCPMCRQKLDMKPRASYNSKTKGYWPLELKLMTASRKGKRKAPAQ